MRKFRMPLLASAVAAAVAAGPASAQWSNLVFFGDSLTDAGQYKPFVPPGTGLFTTNPGPVWAQALGSRYGLSVAPSTQGGTDYAYGGAQVALPPSPPQPPLVPVPIATQVQTAVAKGIDSNTTYFLWGGANDILNGLAQLQAGQVTQVQLQANVATAAAQYAQQVAVLQAAGAKYVVVLNLPDIGKTPFGLGSGQSGSISALTDLYNATALGAQNAVGGNQIRVNINALFKEIVVNPGAYGLANVTGVACTTSSSLTCTPSTLVAPNAAQTYAFADGVHPTTAGHQIVAQAVASMLEGPAQMGSLAEAPLAVEQANWRALDGRMWSTLGAPYVANTLNAWITYDYASPDVGGNAFLTGDGNLNTVAGGLDMRLSPNWLAGVAFGYSEDKVDFGNSTGSFKLDETTMTFYGGWGNGPWYAGGSLMLGNLDYGNVQRNFTIGTGTRNESGNASGWTYAIRALGGYWFKYREILHGPFVKLTYQEARVNAFSEQGADSTALNYAEQKRDSFVTSLGWQVQGTWGAIRPFGRATWEYEAKDDLRYVTASSATLGGSYSVPAYKPDNNWGLFVLGASSDWGKVTGFITGSATAGKGDGDYYAITVGVRVPL